ncbi:hypothetical protein K1719_010211 [Acacia pycnantha]|nr:hypothetical protein K1719_010211 [Acacia pycnantha]
MSLGKPPLPRLLLNDVSCMRNAQQILHHVNVSLHDGSALVLTGANGSVLEGKQGRSLPALEFMGLGSLANERPSRLSMGQRKRLQLARLLAIDRPIWLLDEPSVALDVEGVKLLEYIIAQHRKNGGIVIVATHLPIKIEDGMVLRLPPRFPRRCIWFGSRPSLRLDMDSITSFEAWFSDVICLQQNLLNSHALLLARYVVREFWSAMSHESSVDENNDVPRSVGWKGGLKSIRDATSVGCRSSLPTIEAHALLVTITEAIASHKVSVVELAKLVRNQTTQLAEQARLVSQPEERFTQQQECLQQLQEENSNLREQVVSLTTQATPSLRHSGQFSSTHIPLVQPWGMPLTDDQPNLEGNDNANMFPSSETPIAGLNASQEDP